MILYKFIHRSIPALNLVSSISGGKPEIFSVKLDMAWMGDITDHLEVEIKEDAEKMGWLYSNLNMLFFKYKGDLYECGLQKLKALTEEKLKDKRYTDTAIINCLFRNASGRIITLISVVDLLEISSKVVINEKE